MGKVVSQISMSLVEFITGPNDRIGLALGEYGTLLHEWIYDLASSRNSEGLEGCVETKFQP
jgi:hypothetical protein